MDPSDPYEKPNQLIMLDRSPSLGKDGGILLNEITQLPEAYIRHAFWRAEQGDSTVRRSDVKPIFITKQETPVTVETWESINVGSELEIFAWNPEEMTDYTVSIPNSPFIKELKKNGNIFGVHFEDKNNIFEEDPKKLGVSDELMKAMVEFNFPHSANNETNALIQLIGLKKAVTVIEQTTPAFILPLSALPHRKLNPGDVNEHEYVQRIAHEFMGWENVRQFIGASFQVHVEMFDSEVGLESIDHLQQITPLLLSVSTGSPFMNGKLSLSGEDNSFMNQSSVWKSVRYPTRVVGSPSGGVNQRPVPESIQKYFASAHEMLKDGSIPSPARVLGHHTSFRFRPDIKPKGTIELATPDSFMAHPKKMTAFSTLFKSVVYKVQALIHSNQHDKIPSNLFKLKLTTQDLERLHQDSLSVSQHGLDAVISTPSGSEKTAREQYSELLNWASQADDSIGFPGLPKGVVNELVCSSIQMPDYDLELWTFNDGEEVYDPKSSDFLSGFYETGMGTGSDWLIRRAQQLISEGKSEEDAIRITSTELSKAFHKYIKELNTEDVLEIFSHNY